jgi:hypothetical protein
MLADLLNTHTRSTRSHSRAQVSHLFRPAEPRDAARSGGQGGAKRRSGRRAAEVKAARSGGQGGAQHLPRPLRVVPHHRGVTGASFKLDTCVDASWLQPFKLKYDEVLSSFAFNIQLASTCRQMGLGIICLSPRTMIIREGVAAAKCGARVAQWQRIRRRGLRERGTCCEVLWRRQHASRRSVAFAFKTMDNGHV